MTYSQEAQGVILSYYDIKFLKKDLSEDGTLLLGKIKYDTAFAFLWISVTYLVWRPAVGDVVKGFSYMQTPSHISLLIHDAFNANIKKYYIPSSWRFVPNADDEDFGDEDGVKSLGYWVDENEVKIEGELTFTIRAVNTSGKYVSVEGTLVSENEEESYNKITTENTHKKFLDEDAMEDTTLTVIPEPAKEEMDDVPKYAEDSSADELSD